LIDDAVVFVPFDGDVISTVGVLPRLTVTVLVSVPNPLLQRTVIVLAPSASETELVVVLDVLVPLTLHVVPPGMEVPPLTVNATFVDVAVVFVPLTGAVMTTAGPLPKFTFTASLPGPNEFVQTTVIVLAPAESATELVEVLVELLPLTVQVVPPGIELLPLTV
jgi:hypothetical protein